MAGMLAKTTGDQLSRAFSRQSVPWPHRRPYQFPSRAAVKQQEISKKLLQRPVWLIKGKAQRSNRREQITGKLGPLPGRSTTRGALVLKHLGFKICMRLPTHKILTRSQHMSLDVNRQLSQVTMADAEDSTLTFKGYLRCCLDLSF